MTVDKFVSGNDPIISKSYRFILLNFAYIDRDVIGQFVGTIVPVTETCFNWYMNFDLADKSDDMKRLVWEFTIDYKEAKSYRKERDGMLRQNQWHDLTVRVFM